VATEVDPAAVQSFNCFRGLGDAEARTVAQVLEPVHLDAGQSLFRQGDPGDALYLLVAGQMEVRIPVRDGEEYPCTTLDAGAIFGEIGPLLEEPRTASVVARTDARLWRLSRERFQAALDRGEAWASKFLLATVRTLARRLVALNQEMIGRLADLPPADRGPGFWPDAERERQLVQMFDDELLGLVGRSFT
jgi:CRP-like cAMP-binding protein